MSAVDLLPYRKRLHQLLKEARRNTGYSLMGIDVAWYSPLAQQKMRRQRQKQQTQ